MKVRVVRGHDRVGESIVEISTTTTKIWLDIGKNLEENDTFTSSEIEGLHDSTSVDARFVLHSRVDHIGLLPEMCGATSLFIGEVGARMLAALHTYKGIPPCEVTGYFHDGEDIKVGDVTVTPILIEESMAEAYMLVIRGEGKCMVYTDDFHSNSKVGLEATLQKLPKKLDMLICEFSTIQWEEQAPMSEKDLEEHIVNVLNKKTGPAFAYQSMDNLSRLLPLFEAAKRTKRVLLEDLYMAEITTAIGGTLPNPNGFIGVKAFATTGYQPDHVRYRLFRRHERMNKEEMVKVDFLLCVNSTMKKFLKGLWQAKRFKNGVLFYSPEAGHPEPQTKEFLKFAESKGLEVVVLPTNGYVNGLTLKSLIKAVNPARIVPVHIDNADWLSDEFSDIKVLTNEWALC